MVTVFLDDGGVLSDNARRAPEWQRLVGAFLAPVLGGAPETWAEANRVGLSAFWPGGAATDRSRHGSVGAFVRARRVEWLQLMCAHAGVPCPPPAEALDLANGAHAYVTRRVRAAMPGAVAAVRALRARGIALHTASGEASDELDGYLRGMRVRGCFGTLYGPDVVNEWKDGPRYYPALFAHVGVRPADAVVVDDSPQQIRLALAAGARAVLVAPPAAGTEEADAWSIPSLAHLPAVVDRWAGAAIRP